MSTISSSLSASLAAKLPKGFKPGKLDDPASKFFRCLLYGPTGSWKTVTAAKFGGPERTLIIGTRAVSQYAIPLEGMGFRPVILAHDVLTFKWAMTNPEAAADAIGFPEWKEREDRVLVVDDWTEGAQMLVDDNETTEEGKEIKDGRKIYGGVKEDVRLVLNSLKRRNTHYIFTALQREDDWAIYPDMPVSTRKSIESDFDYVFYLNRETKRMITEPFSQSYGSKDTFGKEITRLRAGFAKKKEAVGVKAIAKEEPMDLALVWNKVVGAK